MIHTIACEEDGSIKPSTSTLKLAWGSRPATDIAVSPDAATVHALTTRTTLPFMHNQKSGSLVEGMVTCTRRVGGRCVRPRAFGTRAGALMVTREGRSVYAFGIAQTATDSITAFAVP